jgi:aminomuconate-semialdehyde/2-hydroxymuconate-6-semialdehyde dehydrogenase
MSSTVSSGTLELSNIIGGDAVPAANGETFEALDPHDASVLAIAPRGSAEDARRAVGAARKAFDEGPWARMDAQERRTLLHALADKLEENADELVDLETRDTGRPISIVSMYDVGRSALNFRFFADYAAGVANDAYPSKTHFSYVNYPPAGVVVAISPWNLPLMLSTWKVAPALAFGNTVVLKPAEQTPLTVTRLGELALEAGLPEGVLNIVHGFGPGEVGEALTRDPRVDRITFTGASVTGQAIMRAAADNLIPVSFELGGKSANVVFGDADLDAAVAGAVKGIFSNNGEMCLAGSRLLVHSSIIDEFNERFVAVAESMKVGDPKDPSTQMGPLIEAAHLEKVHGYVELGQAEGGTLLTGGEPVTANGCENGFYYPPTILTGLSNDTRTVREEIFGPVQTVIPFDTDEEALAIANDTEYGLAGMMWTKDLDRAHQLAARWRAGTVWINCFFVRDLRLPFGGVGASGVGREGGQYSREFFTEPQAVVIEHANPNG